MGRDAGTKWDSTPNSTVSGGLRPEGGGHSGDSRGRGIPAEGPTGLWTEAQGALGNPLTWRVGILTQLNTQGFR